MELVILRLRIEQILLEAFGFQLLDLQLGIVFFLLERKLLLEPFNLVLEWRKLMLLVAERGRLHEQIGWANFTYDLGSLLPSHHEALLITVLKICKLHNLFIRSWRYSGIIICESWIVICKWVNNCLLLLMIFFNTVFSQGKGMLMIIVFVIKCHLLLLREIFNGLLFLPFWLLFLWIQR